MLEEILKSINSNIERIADILAAKTENTKENLTNSTKEIISGSIVQMPQQLLQQSAIPQIPVAEMPQQTIPQTIPTASVQENFTQEQLAVAMSNAVSAGKMSVIQEILQQFGVQALTQINPNDYNRLATMLKEKGVEV